MRDRPDENITTYVVVCKNNGRYKWHCIDHLGRRFDQALSKAGVYPKTITGCRRAFALWARKHNIFPWVHITKNNQHRWGGVWVEQQEIGV